jgi:CO dehydrogenase maturation factor
MKIAFVGKGGSGKTTVSSLFAQYSAAIEPTTIIDADINVHVPKMFGMDTQHMPETISSTAAVEQIRTKLIGTNTLIGSTSDMKKSTPPGRGSVIIDFSKPKESAIGDYIEQSDSGAYVMVVGTYEKSEIGISCYHNNLSILENVLSHSRADNATLIVDMVAGTDAFASTMHAQFDLIVLVVEPTRKSLDVFLKFMELAKVAKIEKSVSYVVNKVEDEGDIGYVTDILGTDAYLGYVSRSRHIRNVDRDHETLDYRKLDAHDLSLLEAIREKALTCALTQDERLKMLWELHKRYVSLGYVIARHGDLTTQVDEGFSFDERE